MAWVETSGHGAPEATSAVVGTTGRISGKRNFVLDLDVAERIFVVGRAVGTQGTEGLGLYAIDADAPGVSIRRLETLD